MLGVFAGQLRFNELLLNHTSWRVGGVADRFYQPLDKADLISFLKTMPQSEPIFWIGLGSNLLVRDGGIRGTVIQTKNRLKAIHRVDEHRIYVEAGVPCALVAKFCAEQGLVGAEFLAGIPGTMGGALRMNAGAFGGETWRIVENVELLSRNGDVACFQAGEFQASYRRVNVPEAQWFLSAILTLQSGDTQTAQQTIRTLLAQRAHTQPTNQPSCGSVFKNPEGDFAARLIEVSGLKGYTLGGAQVSTKHANFIINTGNASAEDIECLIDYVQQQVAQQQGIMLKTEVCIVGEQMVNRHITFPEQFGRVAVLMGGVSAERDISLKSGKAVFDALVAQKIEAQAIDLKEDVVNVLCQLNVDRVFNLLHGRGGEDGMLQGVLEYLKLPYTGSGVLGSALAMDKYRTKLCWRGANLPTPDWFVLNDDNDIDACIDVLGFPVIVKPTQEGSSVGMSKAKNRDELIAAFKHALSCGCAVYAEKWVDGKEYTVAILQGQALPVICVETNRDFYDYEAKYHANTTQYHCPCGLSEQEENLLQSLALKANDLIGVEGWARVDVFIDHHGPQLIEINTVPGMTDHSLLPMAAKQAGIDFNTLVWRILETSFK